MHFLGKNLRWLRKQSSKTQSEIAALIKKGQTTVGNWENGISEPNLEELLIISNYFDIPLDTLLKVDLSEVNVYQRQGNSGVAMYDHADAEASMAREDKLNYVLEEIKNLREEMERINSRLPENK
ncbi:helix-turn-helix domain-containing protein [Puia sp. P3]|uniref:helix-turn-helix domain-containing protein n=1 Tax=Puia sp. P3 TaxID=3423952 RepID=UPI003D67D2A2